MGRESNKKDGRERKNKEGERDDWRGVGEGGWMRGREEKRGSVAVKDSWRLDVRLRYALMSGFQFNLIMKV